MTVPVRLRGPAMQLTDRTTTAAPVRSLAAAAVVAVLVAVPAAWLGALAIDPSWARASSVPGSGPWQDVSTLTILGRNAACALLLFSGVLTGGLSTVAGLVWTGAYFGATFAVSATNAGTGPVLSQVGWYLPIELTALLLAAVAGLHPVCRACVTAGRSLRSAPRAYLEALGPALGVLSVALGLLCVGAVAESAIIRLSLS